MTRGFAWIVTSVTLWFVSMTNAKEESVGDTVWGVSPMMSVSDGKASGIELLAMTATFVSPVTDVARFKVAELLSAQSGTRNTVKASSMDIVLIFFTVRNLESSYRVSSNPLPIY